MREAICSVSVDLDTVRCYEQIYGLPSTSGSRGDAPGSLEEQEADPIYRDGLPRLLDLFDSYQIKATFFVIGRDAEHPAHASVLRDAVARGHELANHSYDHPYRLIQMQPHEIETQIVAAGDAIGALLPEGERVVGFRCPGYNNSPEVIEALRRHRYLYDSSTFPCPPYLMARASAIGLFALQGRISRSLPGPPEALWAPMDPYRPSNNPHKRGSGDDLWELPMSVVPGVRLPYIGTYVMVYPLPLLKLFTRLTARRFKLLNFELHGIDILDADDPGLAHLAPHQFDLRVPLDEKMRRYDLCFRQIAKTHRFDTLKAAVGAL